ncbi:MAG: nicotinamide mononucleotide transporter [Ignavibacteriales bacterium]|nr:nicotinamide mononucleotide transporter [Ignavibacteriales bacterium]
MTTIEEIIAVILGVIAVYLSTRQNVWTYPLGIVSVFLYIEIFYDVKLYADMGLQVFFIILQAYGWYEWLYGGENKTALHVSRIPGGTTMILGFVVSVGTLALGYTLHQLTDASLPYVDSLLAVLSMAAQWMLAKKYLENWTVWIAVNIGSIAMYGYKELYFTMVLYGVYLVLALMGYRAWKRELVLR